MKPPHHHVVSSALEVNISLQWKFYNAMFLCMSSQRSSMAAPRQLTISHGGRIFTGKLTNATIRASRVIS